MSVAGLVKRTLTFGKMTSGSSLSALLSAPSELNTLSGFLDAPCPSVVFSGGGVVAAFVYFLRLCDSTEPKIVPALQQFVGLPAVHALSSFRG